MSVMSWMRSHIATPRPAGPETLIHRFTPDLDTPIARDGIIQNVDGWRVKTGGKRSFRLFALRDPKLENCLLTYRARMRSEGVQQRAYLQMWCHIPDEGEYVSKGAHTALKGDNGWVTCETRFQLKPGQRPDAIKLNLAFDGPGAVDIRDIWVTVTPLT